MSLGFALLHPGRIEVALRADARKTAFDDASELVLTLLHGGRLADDAQGFLDGITTEFDSLTAAFDAQGDVANPFDGIAELFSGDGAPDFAAILDRVTALLEALDPESVGARVDAWLDGLFAALPALDGPALARRFRDVALTALELMEKPFTDGRRDAVANAMLRAATFIRCQVRELLEGFDELVGNFDLTVLIRTRITLLVGRLDAGGLGRVRELVAKLQDILGPMLRAAGDLSASFSSNVSVDLDGPDGAPLPLADLHARGNDWVSHEEAGGAIWWLDLISNFFASFNQTYEMWRTAAWDKGGEIALQVIGMVFDYGRTLARAVWPEKINAGGAWGWIFSDWTSMMLQFLMRIFGAFMDAYDRKGDFMKPNYWLSVGQRLLNWFSYVGYPRMGYQFARSVSYFGEWKESLATDQVTSEHTLATPHGRQAALKTLGHYDGEVNGEWGETCVAALRAYQTAEGLTADGIWSAATATRMKKSLTRVPLTRFVWATWGPVWILNILASFPQPWEWYGIAQMPWWMFLEIGIFGGLGMLMSWFFATKAFGGVYPWEITLTYSWWELTLITALAVWTFVTVLMLFEGVDTTEENKTTVHVLLGVLLTLLGAGLLITVITWLSEDRSHPAAQVGLHITIGFGGLVIAGMLPFIMSWAHVQDGQDREEQFRYLGNDGKLKDLKHEESPYSLPFPSGERWLCGQANHGAFSHLYTSSSNVLSYDFNTGFDDDVLASRPGVVVQLQDQIADGEPSSANNIVIQHYDWHEGIDPGTTNERVITYANYWHLAQAHVWTVGRHRVRRGYHLAGVDDTGTSALHHLHFGANSHNRSVRFQPAESNEADKAIASEWNVPVVFKDSDTHWYRHYPLFIWTWFTHVPGKPVAFAYYGSDNTPADPLPNPVVLTAALAGTTAHSHQLFIDYRDYLRAAAAAGSGDWDSLPAELIAYTTVAEGHFHQVKLDQAAQRAVLGVRDLGSLSTEPDADGHSHPLVLGTRVALSTDWHDIDGVVDHRHSVSDVAIETLYQSLQAGTVAALNITTANTLWYEYSSDSSGWGGATYGHTHNITIDEANQRILMTGEGPPTTASANANIGVIPAHTHVLTFNNGLADPRHGRIDDEFGARAVFVVPPPAGQLLSRAAGPYDLLGDQLILRVSDRQTDHFFWGATRPSVAGFALDRGPARTDQVNVNGTVGSFGAGAAPAHISVRELAAAINQNQGSGSPWFARPEPVVVIETTARGSTAALAVDPADQTATLSQVFGLDTAVTGRGSGAVGQLGLLTRAALANQFAEALGSGWPAVPGDLAVAVTGGTVALSETGASGPEAVDLSHSAAKLAQVLGGIYQASVAAAALQLPLAGPAPVTGGRLVVRRKDGGSSWDAPVLGVPARVELDTSAAAFSGSSLVDDVMVVRVRDGAQPVRFQAGDSSAAAVARRIMLEAEGVRAWVSNTNRVTVETVAGGDDLSLQIEKPAGSTIAGPDSGQAASLVSAGGGATNTVNDTTRVRPVELANVVEDALARAGVAAPVAVEATIDDGSGRLILEVPSTHQIEAAEHFPSVGGGGALQLAHTVDSDGADQLHKLQSRVLAEPVDLPGPGWVDVTVQSQTGPSTPVTVRVLLDAEPARLELGPLTRLPASGESLTLRVGTTDVAVAFDGSQADLSALAAHLEDRLNSSVTGAVRVRIAYRLVFEGRAYGSALPGLQLGATNGLLGAGFLAPPPTSPGVGIDPDHMSFDASGTPPTSTTPAAQLVGEQVAVCTVADTGTLIRFTVDTGEDLRIRRDAPTAPLSGGDPIFDMTSGGGVDTGAITHLPDGTTRDSRAFTTVDLGADVLIYRLQTRVRDFDTGLATDWRVRDLALVQLAAAPARLRTTAALTGAPGSLTITVTEPTSPTDTAERTGVVDLTGVTALQDVAWRIQAQVPQVLAWVVRVGTDDRLHIETRGRGSGWGLKLTGAGTLISLGFGRGAITMPEGSISGTGAGNIRDRRAATRAEVLAAFTAAAARGVRAVDRPYGLDRTGDRLDLVAPGQTLDLVASPTVLGDRMGLALSGGAARIDPGAPQFGAENGSLQVRVDGQEVATVLIFGSHARLVGSDTLPTVSGDVTAMLDFLKDAANRWTISTESGSHMMGPLDPAIDNIDDAISWMALRAPTAWIGLEQDPGVTGDRYLAITSRRRGSSSSVELDLSTIGSIADFTGQSFLGFVLSDLQPGGTTATTKVRWTVTDTGEGTVADLDNVSVDALEVLLDTAQTSQLKRQHVLTVATDPAGGAPATVRLTGPDPTASLVPSTATFSSPGGLAFAPPSGSSRTDLLEATHAATEDFEPGITELVLTQGGVPRTLQAFVWARPARLPTIQLPAAAAALNGHAFRLTVDDVPYTVLLSVPSGTTLDQLPALFAAQIERLCSWTVRVRAVGTLGTDGGGNDILVGGGLTIETVHLGTGAKLRLDGAPLGTNDALPLFTNTAAVDGQTDQGEGIAPDLRAVTPSQYQAVLESALIPRTSAADTLTWDTVAVDLRAYEAGATAAAHLRIRAGRTGCDSAVEPLVDAPRLDFDRSLQRGPAVRGSARIGPFTSGVALAGSLTIRFNENDGTADLPPSIQLQVDLAGVDSAEGVAERIRRAARDTSVGTAGAYADGHVVIETATLGLAGSVRVLAPTDASLAGKVDATAQLANRGWPSAGAAALRPGYRSGRAIVDSGRRWRFRLEVLATAATATATVPAGQVLERWQTAEIPLSGAGVSDLPTLSAAVDAGLAVASADTSTAATGTRRIGVCAMGSDGTLYVEGGVGDNLVLLVDGDPVPTHTPTLKGMGVEVEGDPGAGLRRTDLTRTYRLVRDMRGDGDSSQWADVGWVRHPTNRLGLPRAVPKWAWGRYYLAVRAEAARTADYDGSADMVRSSGTATIDGRTVPIVHQANYWVSLADADGGNALNPLALHQRPAIDGVDATARILVEFVRS